MKKKIFLSMIYAASLSPMFLNQYGGAKGVQEITGLINLFNPIGILSVLLFAIGVWVPFGRSISNKVLSLLGMLGIVVSEIYQFLTWHILTITGEMSIQTSIRLAFPEFYIGLIVSILMIVVYFVIERPAKE